MNRRKIISYVIFSLNVIPVYGMGYANQTGNYGGFVFMCYAVLGLVLTGWLIGDY